MKIHKLLLFSMIVIALASSACTSAQPVSTMADDQAMTNPANDMSMHETTTPEAMMGEASGEVMATASEDLMMQVTATPEAMMGKSTEDMMITPDDGMKMPDTSSPEAMMEVPGWYDVSLTNVNDGSAFTISSFNGKVVLVETMAVWCPTCKRQQEQIASLHADMGMNPDLVTISLDIDPNENADLLKTFASDNGFKWVYAVAPKDVAREIGTLYGDQFLNPPSTPILIIDKHGEAHPLPFGVKSADDLRNAIEPYLNEM